MLAILILAAGNSSRMRGADKLMRVIDGAPLLQRTTERALSTGLPVYVALTAAKPERFEAVNALDAHKVMVQNAASGMGQSISEGVHAVMAEGCKGVMILPADMPDITTDDLQCVKNVWLQNTSQIVRGASKGRPGHPVVFPKSSFKELASLSGDLGARHVISTAGSAPVLVELPEENAVLDLDTPEEWQAWENQQAEMN